MELFSNVVRGLRGSLELHQQRHRIITENIANVETPGYRARDSTSATRSSRPSRRRAAAAAARAGARRGGRRPRAPVKIDGNSVDLDLEMARLSENAFRIIALSRILAQASTPASKRPSTELR